MSEPKFYILKDAAEIAKFSEQTLRRAIKEGRLKAHQEGRVWRIASADLYDWLGRPDPNPEAQLLSRGLCLPMGPVTLSFLDEGGKVVKYEEPDGLFMRICLSPVQLELMLPAGNPLWKGTSPAYKTLLVENEMNNLRVEGRFSGIIQLGVIQQHTISLELQEAKAIMKQIEDRMKQGIPDRFRIWHAAPESEPRLFSMASFISGALAVAKGDMDPGKVEKLREIIVECSDLVLAGSFGDVVFDLLKDNEHPLIDSDDKDRILVFIHTIEMEYRLSEPRMARTMAKYNNE